MNTPITDAVADKAFREVLADDYEGYVAMLLHARRLELDRAALLEFAIRVRNTTSSTRIKREATAVIAEARANFPE